MNKLGYVVSGCVLSNYVKTNKYLIIYFFHALTNHVCAKVGFRHKT